MNGDNFGGPEPPDAKPDLRQREQLLGGLLLAEITDRLVLLIRRRPAGQAAVSQSLPALR